MTTTRCWGSALIGLACVIRLARFPVSSGGVLLLGHGSAVLSSGADWFAGGLYSAVVLPIYGTTKPAAARHPGLLP
ncbi:hypothetical protein GM708_17580, partial [Vibrio cholerae]|nr:hypothetical protein [Vibrio cholerae]